MALVEQFSRSFLTSAAEPFAAERVVTRGRLVPGNTVGAVETRPASYHAVKRR